MKCILTVWCGALLLASSAFAGSGNNTIAGELAVNAPPPSHDGWEFEVGFPGWLAGIKGDVGVGGLTPVHVDVPFSKIAEHLDMVAGLTLEARHDRWGFFADGLYLRVSADAATPGPLLNSIEATQSQIMAEAGVAYRLWEGRRGYFDVLVGARYLYLDGRINLNINNSGVDAASEKLSSALVNQVVNLVQQKASAALSQAQTELNSAVTAAKARVSNAVATAETNISNTVVDVKNNARTQIVDAATTAIQNQIDSVLEKYPHLPAAIERNGPVVDAIRQLVDAKVSAAQATLSSAQAAASAKIQAGVATQRLAVKNAITAKLDAISAAATAKLQATASRAQSAANKAVQRAQQNLAKQIATAIKQAIPQQVTGSKGWVDPFVGFRARYNFTDHLYATVRADIGGFGVASKLDWMAYGALGWQFNRHWSTELGYRYLSIDYDRGGFVYDVALEGAYLGVTYKF